MSAVIYAAIVVMWAVVLVPMWLRRHDAATESRSVDRFSTAMRTLSRRTTAAPGRRYVVMPRRSEAGPSVHVSGAAVAQQSRQVQQPERPAPARSAEAKPARRARPTRPVRPAARPASLVARRRRLLLGLLAFTFLTVVLASVGVLSWPLQIVVDVVLVAFCLHLRTQAKRAAAVARQRRRVAVATVSPAPARRPAAAPVSAPLVAPPVEADRPEIELGDEVVAATGTDAAGALEDTWEPVPVPRPTYTMKPPAPAYEADPTYRPPVYEPPVRETAAETPVAAAPDTDLDEILERPWAVND